MTDIVWTDEGDSSSAFCASFGSGSIASIDRWRDDLFEWNAPIPYETADGQLYGCRQSRHSGSAKTLEDAKLFVAIELAIWFFRSRPTEKETPGGS